MDVGSRANRLTWRLVSGTLVATLFAGCAKTKSSSSSGQSPFPADGDLAVMFHYLVEDGATLGIVFGRFPDDLGVYMLRPTSMPLVRGVGA